MLLGNTATRRFRRVAAGAAGSTTVTSPGCSVTGARAARVFTVQALVVASDFLSVVAALFVLPVIAKMALGTHCVSRLGPCPAGHGMPQTLSGWPCTSASKTPSGHDASVEAPGGCGRIDFSSVRLRQVPQNV
jgi:hypothetical protein